MTFKQFIRMNSAAETETGGAEFGEGEKVLCYHGPLLYEAKILHVEQRSDGDWRFFVHYNGWNTKWDELVAADRIVKHDAEGMKKQGELITMHGKAALRKRGPSSRPQSTRDSSPSIDSDDGARNSSVRSSKRLNTDSTVQPESGYSKAVEVKIDIPSELKNRLVDDWDLITKQFKLLHIPAKLTAEELLLKFLTEQRETYEEDNEKISEVEEFVSGLTDYFNVVLGNQLLYKLVTNLL